MTDNEHSSGGKLSVKSDFECLEEEEIHLKGIFSSTARSAKELL